MIFTEEQYNKWMNGLTEEERGWLMTAPEKLWKETLCNRCREVTIKHNPYFNKADARSYWCDECLSVVMEENKQHVAVESRSVDADQYRRMMDEMQAESSAVSAVAGVSRNATFQVAQAVLRPDEQPALAAEHPRLTLKVDK